MKRGKEEEEEKVVGPRPMFPRLHVNDKEKGGPRAPPRNKMALYEQFTVPSQKFNNSNARLLPLTANNNNNPQSSSNQGTGLERSYVFPVHPPSQAPSRGESYVSQSHQFDGVNQNTSLAQLERRKSVDEDDFMVPVYIHSRNCQPNDRTPKSFNGRNLTPMGSGNFSSLIALENNGDRGPKQFGSPLSDIGKDVGGESERLPQVSSSREQPAMSVKTISSRESMDSFVRKTKLISNQEDVSNVSRSRWADARLQQEFVAGSQSNDNEHDDCSLEGTRDTVNGNTLVPRGCFSSANQTSPQEANGQCDDTRTSGPMQEGNSDESDNISKISTVENLSSSKVSPDDVVGILGQKHFWKARREIANQQRIFAVQVFELHRLIKVQQLIAASPDLLVEDAAFVGKIPMKESATQNISLEVVIQPKRQNLKCKDDSQKPNHKMECSAENAVGRTSVLSLENGTHLSNYAPFPGNPHQASIASDDRFGPACFNPSPGHQWLVPVMSSSEGLVYKPYPAPGFTGPMGGGFGPFPPVPLSSAAFMNPVYGVPISHKAIGVPPYIPPGSHAYFPPYGMPVMNQAVSGSAVEQTNHFAAPQGSHIWDGCSSAGGANSNTHNQGSSNLPVQRNGSASHVKKFQASKKGALQGSSASNHCETTQGTRTRQIGEERDAQHSPFRISPVISDGIITHRSLETRQQTRVIKVVPHNRRSATESAARIFQSIQEERKQYD